MNATLKNNTMRTSCFTHNKNTLLALVYTHNATAFSTLFTQTSHHARQIAHLIEADQKALNQILHIYRTFRKELSSEIHPQCDAAYQSIRTILSNTLKQTIHSPGLMDFQNWFEQLGLDINAFHAMLSTVTSVQLTVGCTNHCRRCNEWALPGVRKLFSFEAVKRLIDELITAGNNGFALYSASDPLDWRHGNKTIIDILEYVKKRNYTLSYGLLTKIPRQATRIARTLLETGADLAVSITAKNRCRIEHIEARAQKHFSVQHDTDQLTIAARWDEDFRQIQPSVTDHYGTEITPEGASIVIPTFTSALHPTGQCRIPITQDTHWLMPRKVGLAALKVAYFKPLQVTDLQGNTVTLPQLLDAQIENILLDTGTEELPPPGMMSMREYFSTFESKAIVQRQKLIPVVEKELREKALKATIQPELPEASLKEHWIQQLQDYRAMCQPEKVAVFKKKALSFYLSSIAAYLKTHPAEREIVAYLRAQMVRDHDYLLTKKRDGLEIESLIDRAIPAWDVFQGAILILLGNPYDSSVKRFTNAYPAKYNSMRDRFEKRL